MRNDAAPGPLTTASAAKPPGRLGREDARRLRAPSQDQVVGSNWHSRDRAAGRRANGGQDRGARRSEERRVGKEWRPVASFYTRKKWLRQLHRRTWKRKSHQLV